MGNNWKQLDKYSTIVFMKHRSSGGLWIVLFLLLTPLTILPAQDARERELKVRGDYYYPPFEFLNDQGEPTGFNIELFKAVAEVMDLNYSINLGPWSEVRSELETGKIDLITGMFYSDHRDSMMDFSISHSIVSHTVFVRRGSDIKHQKDIEGKEILVQEGDIVHDYLLQHHITDYLIPVEDQQTALKILNKGFHDAAFLAKLQGIYFMEELNLRNIRTIEDTLIPRRYCFAVREGDDELVSLLNEGLNILRLNGTYEKIYDRWFGVIEQRNLLRNFKRILIITAASVVTLMGILLAWTWSLRITVINRTDNLNREIKERTVAQEKLQDSEKQLMESLEEKEILLSEIHHRVKNNLQIISSLLELQRSRLAQPELDEALLSSQTRIRSMSLIHEQLYTSENFSSINLQEYIEEMVQNIYHAFEISSGHIRFRQEIKPVSMDIERAIPLGLILTEVITNSIKYAFPEGEQGEIFIKVDKADEGSFIIVEIADNGIGIGDSSEISDTLGVKLIQSLAIQLKAEITTDSIGGTRYLLRIPVMNE